MRGWYGDKVKHGLASRGMRTLKANAYYITVKKRENPFDVSDEEILSNPLFDLTGFSEKRKQTLLKKLKVEYTDGTNKYENLLDDEILFKYVSKYGTNLFVIRSKLPDKRVVEEAQYKVIWDAVNVPILDDENAYKEFMKLNEHLKEYYRDVYG